ncbi:3'(2'),5'-bisphosphate nucleotidase CysQ [Lichenicoccus sp.]|uniref:3'(2'),5'-bisphosphate nucleotidase CysQ n=1 Tax=Lichenicoccus sp. TaxID=2781899 RepID=UPI003D152A6F
MIALAVRAGGLVQDHFNGAVSVSRKADHSPVTAADRDAELLIMAGLAALAPWIPVIAEEAASAGLLPAVGACFFLVDPLDGTREFIAGGTDFTVNIGLIEDGAPSLGVVYAPARAALYWGDVAAGTAWRAEQSPYADAGVATRIAVRKPGAILCAVASKSHSTAATEAWLAAAGVGQRVSIGSSLKFVLVASGEADVYPRPAPTMEWDTAAGDAILRAAGGRVLDLDNHPLAYGKPRFANPGFIATGPYQPAPLRPLN